MSDIGSSTEPAALRERVIAAIVRRLGEPAADHDDVRDVLEYGIAIFVAILLTLGPLSAGAEFDSIIVPFLFVVAIGVTLLAIRLPDGRWDIEDLDWPPGPITAPVVLAVALSGLLGEVMAAVGWTAWWTSVGLAAIGLLGLTGAVRSLRGRATRRQVGYAAWLEPRRRPSRRERTEDRPPVD